MRALARRLRLNGMNERIGADFQDPLAVFVTTLRTHSSAVHQILRSLFHVPEKNPERQGAEENAAIEALLQELWNAERTKQRLHRLGFRKLTQSYDRLCLLHDGPPYAPASPKRRKIFCALAPTLFREICQAPDPDRAWAYIADRIASSGARSSFLALLHENPYTLRR